MIVLTDILVLEIIKVHAIYEVFSDSPQDSQIGRSSTVLWKSWPKCRNFRRFLMYKTEWSRTTGNPFLRHLNPLQKPANWLTFSPILLAIIRTGIGQFNSRKQARAQSSYLVECNWIVSYDYAFSTTYFRTLSKLSRTSFRLIYFKVTAGKSH